LRRVGEAIAEPTTHSWVRGLGEGNELNGGAHAPPFREIRKKPRTASYASTEAYA
jgi:hypothetical protein